MAVSALALIGPLSPLELILILVLIVLLFGVKRLPDAARGLAKSIGAFKKGLKEEEQEEKKKELDERP